MRTRVETVSPAMARRWLDATTEHPQRGLRRVRVDKFRETIETGAWMLTHQGVAIATDGHVIDGQHRLTAIAESGISVEMLVSRDVPDDVFDVVDVGLNRSPADALKVAGYAGNGNVYAAVVRTLIVWREFGGTAGENYERRDRDVTAKDIVDWLDADPVRFELLRVSVSDARRIATEVSRQGSTTGLSIADMIFRLSDGSIVTDEIRQEFVERLTDGAMLPARSPILAMRRWLTNDSGYVFTPRMIRRQVTAANYIKALNDYATGTERDRVMFRWKKEPLPVPIVASATDGRQPWKEPERVSVDAS